MGLQHISNQGKINIIYALVGIIVLLFLLLLPNNTLVNTNVQPVHNFVFAENWLDDNGQVQILDRQVKLPATNKVIITGHVTRQIPAGQRLLMYIYQVDSKVFVNGQEIADVTDSIYTRWETCKLPELTPQDKITIALSSSQKSIDTELVYIYLDHLSYGNIYSLLLAKLQGNLLKIMVSGFIFIIGLAILFTLGIFNYFNLGMRSGNMACGFLLVIGSLCTFIDYEYVTLLIPYPKIINRIDVLSQLFVCEFLMIYFRGFLHRPLYVKWINRLLGLWSLVIIGFCILMLWDNTDILQHYDKLPYIVVPMLLVGLYFLLAEYKDLQDDNIRRLLLSGSCVICCTIVEVVHYEISGNYWIFVFQGGLLLFTLTQFGGLLGDTRRRLEQAERVKEMESKLVEGQIDILCTQIKPHFIFNVLNTISSLCLTNPTKADEVVMYLSKYLRTNINALEHRDKVPFVEELDNIECYVAIEQIRFGERIKFVKDIQVEDFQVPALSLEPLVENAIKHGVSRKKEGGTVKLSTRAESDSIVITVEDDGLGFDLAQVSGDKDSIGIDNVRRRLSYSMQAQMDISSSFSKGTKIVVRLPLMGGERKEALV